DLLVVFIDFVVADVKAVAFVVATHTVEFDAPVFGFGRIFVANRTVQKRDVDGIVVFVDVVVDVHAARRHCEGTGACGDFTDDTRGRKVLAVVGDNPVVVHADIVSKDGVSGEVEDDNT